MGGTTASELARNIRIDSAKQGVIERHLVERLAGFRPFFKKFLSSFFRPVKCTSQDEA
jgi:hypothetical protein